MSSYKHILVACDLHSEDDDPVTAKAQDLAKMTGAKLSLIHVVELIYTLSPEDGGIHMTQWQEEMTEAARKRLASLGEKLGVAKEDQHVLIGSAKEAILQEAATLKADLIVLGSHRRRGIQAFLLGSTAEGVLHKAPCDVFAVQVANVPATV